VQCSAVQCSAVQCSAVPRELYGSGTFSHMIHRTRGEICHYLAYSGTVHCSTVSGDSAVQYSTVQCIQGQCSAVPCRALQGMAVLHCSAGKYRAVQCSAVQRSSDSSVTGNQQIDGKAACMIYDLPEALNVAVAHVCRLCLEKGTGK
jgi:hypothetical protein